jgi:hypothetical protein
MTCPIEVAPFASRRLLALAVAGSLIVSGCAAPGPGGSTPPATGGSQSAPVASGDCNPVLAAGLGALVGGLLGGGKNTLRGAALGSSVAALACVALNYQAQQVKTGKQVQDEYKLAHRGALPEQATLVRYDTTFSPSSIRGGQKAQTMSYIEVAAGTRDTAPQVEEELTLFKPDGTLLQTVRKPVSATNGSGAFKGGFSIPLPEGVPQGLYPIKTALYLNGKRVAGQDNKLQVVDLGARPTTLALNTY